MKPNIIICGMYAFNPTLRQAWSAIFDSFSNYYSDDLNKEYEVLFEDNGELLNNDQVLIGHTCGYPYIKKLHSSHQLVGVPVFNIPGCQHKSYRSWFIARSDDPRNHISEYKNSVATINNWDSNSGMNVFRHEVSKYAQGKAFFESVIENGSHLTSIKYVIEERADIAAIDCVTWHFALAEGRFNPDRIKVIGQSEASPGLPLVIKKSHSLDPERIRLALNQSLETLEPKVRDFIKIREFASIDPSNYDRIREIENQTVEQGYPILR